MVTQKQQRMAALRGGNLHWCRALAGGGAAGRICGPSDGVGLGELLPELCNDTFQSLTGLPLLPQCLLQLLSVLFRSVKPPPQL